MDGPQKNCTSMANVFVLKQLNEGPLVEVSSVQGGVDVVKRRHLSEWRWKECEERKR